MKKLVKTIVLLVSVILVYSCNNDDDSNNMENTPFFNLHTGNYWIYKEYYYSQNQLAFTGNVDSVAVVGTSFVNGLEFHKQITYRKNASTSYYEKDSCYLRINSQGHLVKLKSINQQNIEPITETSGFVLHPGLDFNYVQDHNFIMQEVIFGTIEYKLYNPIEISVENSNYFAYPFKGNFVPLDSFPDLESKKIEYYYTENIGLVKEICPFVTSNSFLENRLIAYSVN